jgi:hypothetical protein
MQYEFKQLKFDPNILIEFDSNCCVIDLGSAPKFLKLDIHVLSKENNSSQLIGDQIGDLVAF